MSEKSDRAKREEEILSFWQENEVFRKTLEKSSPEGEFIFYEGPPTANGRPGMHHVEARAFKDAIPRYKTMRGYHVRRKAGWDTHGLPVELEVEKSLGLKSKKEIEEYGVAKFNEECKKNVWKYVDEWKNFSDRIGFWADMDHPYVTYHNPYIEAVWSVVSEIEKKGFLYKDYKVVPWCPRCETVLSSHELAQGYENVKDLSVTVKFKIVQKSSTDSTYLLAWTTTPWTLPGNIALAVGEDITYIETRNKKQETNKTLILAKARLEVLGKDYEVVREIKGKDLVGLEYEPLYPFTREVYKGEGLDKAYKVYSANFVTTEDGTGIVHTATMYGQEDFEFGTKIGLPKHHLVDESGHFTSEAGFLAGRFVKDEETNVVIIKDLAEKNLLFKKEKYKHSYPFCWRCKTPLIYYARDSWYIAMSKLRDELVRENGKINWEPKHIKKGRFGEWLREIKDWAISRERYWGTPLPVWVQTGNKQETRNNKQKYIIVDSIETLKKYAKTNKNTFIFVRHGEAENNINDICNSDPTKIYHLTEKGRKDVAVVAQKIKTADAIYISPYLRIKETTDIIANRIGYEKKNIKEDGRLAELDFGDFDGKSYSSYLAYDEKSLASYDTALPGGESYSDAKKRFADFLYDIDAKHQKKRIVVVTHGIGLEVIAAAIEGADLKRSKEIIDLYTPKPSEILRFDFVSLPHNTNFELDLHKPYIDDIVLEKDGEEYRRVKEVIDVWFDSGAMPFAQNAEDRKEPGDFSKISFPADFISEALDQTRGWFYTLHAISVLLGRGAAFRNVICLGLLMDKNGKKMSKSIGNIVDPWDEMNKYGVDALRLWMYSVNQPGESKNYDEKSVEEINRRLFNILDNVYSFLELYAGGKKSDLKNSKRSDLEKPANILDQWILTRLNELIQLTTSKLDAYNLIDPVRAFRDFVDDLSTWYLRRSRERIKNGDQEAIKTLRYVLKTFAKILAPFAPFAAEDLYQKLRADDDVESVHLEVWPSVNKGQTLSTDSQGLTLENMKITRTITSLALEQRQKANIKVRQPLASLKVKSQISNLGEEYLELIKDEINVKEIMSDPNLESEVSLDTAITPELEMEGRMRDLVRVIQDIRKKRGLKPGEKMAYKVGLEDKELFTKYSNEIIRATDIELT